VHDYNPGIEPSGLFWTAQLPAPSLTGGPDGATLTVENLDVIDIFFFGNPGPWVPGVVSYEINFTATGEMRHLRPSSDDPLDPTNLTAQFRDAFASGTFSAESVTEPGGEPFSFTGAFASTEFTWAEIGMMRNGWFDRQ
jgi:hypothetical protein